MITNVTFVPPSDARALGAAARAWLRLALVLSATLLCWLVALPAHAAVTEEGAPNMMVRPFDGPKGKALQERVVKVLEEQGADLVPAGFEGPTALETDEDYASVAARLNIRAYILGTASNDNTGWKLKLTVRQGSDGTVKGDAEFDASWFPGLLTKIDEELITTLENVLSGTKPPEDPVVETEPTDEAPEVEKPRPRPLDERQLPGVEHPHRRDEADGAAGKGLTAARLPPRGDFADGLHQQSISSRAGNAAARTSAT